MAIEMNFYIAGQQQLL